MGYSLKRKEKLPDGIRRVVTEQIDAAVRDLAKQPAEIEEGIHEARKRFKKIRAVLRLVRDELGDVYGRENRWFRDAGRYLADYRDITAMTETLGKLREAMADTADPAVFESASAFLENRRTQATGSSDLYSRTRKLISDLEGKREEIPSWPLKTNTFAAVQPGLRRTYRRGRRAMRAAYQDMSPAAFHEWRKRVKYHWYHARLLSGVWPDVMAAYTEELHRLSDILGDYHDLVLLRDNVANEMMANTSCDGGLLNELIDKRQLELRQEALPLGYRVYADKSKKFVRRMEHYWEAWRRPWQINPASV